MARAILLDQAPPFKPKNKISIIGCSQVDLAIAYALLNQGTVGTLVLVNMEKSKLEGEVMDLQQGSAFYSCVCIECSDDIAITAKLDIVVLAAGTVCCPAVASRATGPNVPLGQIFGSNIALDSRGKPNEAHCAIHANVVLAGAQVTKKKGHNSWAIVVQL
eukprot:14030819-Ditylum_brightwellii.AAC.1